MIESIKKRWLAALRSGEYQKGKGAYKKGQRYCCLGVLTDLYAKEHSREFKNCFLESQQASLSPRVADWAGLPTIVNVVPPRNGGLKENIADVNDGAYGRKTFKQIANMIEEQL